MDDTDIYDNILIFESLKVHAVVHEEREHGPFTIQQFLSAQKAILLRSASTNHQYPLQTLLVLQILRPFKTSTTGRNDKKTLTLCHKGQ